MIPARSAATTEFILNRAGMNSFVSRLPNSRSSQKLSLVLHRPLSLWIWSCHTGCIDEQPRFNAGTLNRKRVMWEFIPHSCPASSVSRRQAPLQRKDFFQESFLNIFAFSELKERPVIAAKIRSTSPSKPSAIMSIHSQSHRSHNL